MEHLRIRCGIKSDRCRRADFSTILFDFCEDSLGTKAMMKRYLEIPLTQS